MKCKIGEIRSQWMANLGFSMTEAGIIEPTPVLPAITCASQARNSELP
jgi:hypothetical protein